MNLSFERSFLKSLDKISDEAVKNKIVEVIINVEEANSLHEINQLKKLKGFKNYYRIRLGDYRIGLEVQNNDMVIFVLIAHRKEVYRRFP